MKVILAFAVIAVTAGLHGQELTNRSTPPDVRSNPRVSINAHVLPPEAVVSMGGRVFLDANAVAEALGGTIDSQKTFLSILSQVDSAPLCKTAEPQKIEISDKFRKSAIGIPDEIERLRIQISASTAKNGVMLPAPVWRESEELHKQIDGAARQITTSDDRAIYYALAHAEEALMIGSSRQLRDASSPATGEEPTRRDLLDSQFCSLESKFALLKGELLSDPQCSVLARAQTKTQARH